jgi:type II secretory pathway component PulM
MTALIALLAIVLLVVVVFVVSAPLRARGNSMSTRDPEQEDLEAARAAKYREIRDAELDYRTGKLSLEDYEAVDGSLRSEAVEILDRLQASGEHRGEELPRKSKPQANPESVADPRDPDPDPQADG